MRKLLNTLYITNELAYLSLDGENLVCSIEGKQALRVPFDNIENVVCFNYLGCSPALMGKCADSNIPISFVSPGGKFLANVCGPTRGNVFLRVAQIDCFRDKSLLLAQNTVAAKLSNCRQLIRRSLHDNESLRQDGELRDAIVAIGQGIETVYSADCLETVMGIEGNCAHSYFSVFNKLITNRAELFHFSYRNKRPPLDAVNALLSFVYTLLTNECASALETVGIDSYIGFYHSLRSGRASLACDLVEEQRCITERFVLSVINLRMLDESDFERQLTGAVWLSKEGRRKVLGKWQEKKRSELIHPFLRQKIPYGLLPYVQSNLLAKFIRGDIREYPCFLLKG